MPKIRKIVLRAALGFFSLIFSVLSLPAVRDFLWGKMTKKAKEKIVDAEHKVVDAEVADANAKPGASPVKKKKKKRKLFG